MRCGGASPRPGDAPHSRDHVSYAHHEDIRPWADATNQVARTALKFRASFHAHFLSKVVQSLLESIIHHRFSPSNTLRFQPKRHRSCSLIQLRCRCIAICNNSFVRLWQNLSLASASKHIEDVRRQLVLDHARKLLNIPRHDSQLLHLGILPNVEY